MKTRYIFLIMTLVIIISLIFYLESTKPYILKNSLDISLSTATNRVETKALIYERGKELFEPDGFINTDNITITENLGRNVILLDFWTYSCINCQRTIHT